MFEIQTLICKWDISFVEYRKHIAWLQTMLINLVNYVYFIFGATHNGRETVSNQNYLFLKSAKITNWKETLTLLWILVVNYKKVKNYKNCVCVSMATHHERHKILYF